jgi:hypothetical protein
MFFYTNGSQMAVRFSVLRASRTLPIGRFLILISVNGLIDPWATVRQEGLGEPMKNPLLRIDQATFRFVA